MRVGRKDTERFTMKNATQRVNLCDGWIERSFRDPKDALAHPHPNVPSSRHLFHPIHAGLATSVKAHPQRMLSPKQMLSIHPNSRPRHLQATFATTSWSHQAIHRCTPVVPSTRPFPFCHRGGSFVHPCWCVVANFRLIRCDDGDFEDDGHWHVQGRRMATCGRRRGKQESTERDWEGGETTRWTA